MIKTSAASSVRLCSVAPLIVRTSAAGNGIVENAAAYSRYNFKPAFVDGLFVMWFYNDLSGLIWKKTGMIHGLPSVAADCRRLPPVAICCYRMMEERAKLFAARKNPGKTGL